jgi:hypothetical protein
MNWKPDTNGIVKRENGMAMESDTKRRDETSNYSDKQMISLHASLNYSHEASQPLCVISSSFSSQAAGDSSGWLNCWYRGNAVRAAIRKAAITLPKCNPDGLDGDPNWNP